MRAASLNDSSKKINLINDALRDRVVVTGDDAFDDVADDARDAHRHCGCRGGSSSSSSSRRQCPCIIIIIIDWRRRRE